jgi:hypothetical protein
MSAAGEIAGRLMAVFQSQGLDGRVFSDAEIQHMLPLLILASANDPALMTPDMRRVLTEFAAKADIASGMTDKETQRAIERYYATKPVEPRLLAAFRQFMRNEARDRAGAPGMNTAFAALLGTPMRATRPVDSDDIPRGATKLFDFLLAGKQR